MSSSLLATAPPGPALPPPGPASVPDGSARARRQRVKVPMRLVESAHYADVALAVYMKIKALARREEGCTAGATVLASYLGLSRSSVERGIAQLRRPGPDGVIELPVNQRRSLPGGSGTTARRRVRPMQREERFIWLPVAACEDLTPRQLRAYAVLCFAQVQRIPLSEGELAGHLRHHSGARAGTPLSAAAAGKVVDALEAAGWVSVLRRAGAQGRHQFIAHDIPPFSQGPESRPSAGATAPVGSALDEGSGVIAGEGSLATKEDPSTDRPDDERRPASPAVGEVQVEEQASPVENPGPDPAPTDGVAGFALRAGQQQPPASSSERRKRQGRYNGPALTLHPRIVEVLEPVQVLYERANTFMQRRIAREVGRQLDLGCDAERLRQRLTARFATVMMSEIKDPARWLTGVALPRWGCGHFACEAGVLWPSGEPCATCAEVLAARREQRQRARRIELGQCLEHGLGGRDSLCPLCPSPPTLSPGRGCPDAPSPLPDRSDCRACGCRIKLVGPAVRDGLCMPCRNLREPGTAQPQRPAAPVRCAGWREEACDRNALPARDVCARHRAQELLAEAAG
ncbi:hypothetical protein C9F11_42950 (plasmid) [Streptomyces sp. YIM 121038]|uniref:helix-turn-helix domain-containing protein n=1 Tax=Streptomyces sp. YIM 121038 TaxID=2136401 RepID=UPI001163CFA8|nr:helix-turn-helix domain-containing protein [Streptomyces sp. YIM 121038]QCX82170.1 hypothetical protein C9F11_42950 [Streptomyces sp. YIM 121038]